MKKKSQRFRFCCSCIRMTLLTEDGCYFCSSKFILATKTDDLNIRPKNNAETH